MLLNGWNENTFRSFGYVRPENTVSNCYYLENSVEGIEDTEWFIDGITTGTKVTEEEMKSEEMVEKLNTGENQAWKPDTNNINDGYPILSWQQ